MEPPILMYGENLDKFYNFIENKITESVKKAIQTERVNEVVFRTFSKNEVAKKINRGNDRINKLITAGVLQQTPDGLITGKSLVEYVGYEVLTEKKD